MCSRDFDVLRSNGGRPESSGGTIVGMADATRILNSIKVGDPKTAVNGCGGAGEFS